MAVVLECGHLFEYSRCHAGSCPRVKADDGCGWHQWYAGVERCARNVAMRLDATLESGRHIHRCVNDWFYVGKGYTVSGKSLFLVLHILWSPKISPL